MKELLDRLEAQTLEIQRLKNIILEQNLHLVQTDEIMSKLPPDTGTVPPATMVMLTHRLPVETMTLTSKMEVTRQLVEGIQKQIPQYLFFDVGPSDKGSLLMTARASLGIMKVKYSW